MGRRIFASIVLCFAISMVLVGIFSYYSPAFNYNLRLISQNMETQPINPFLFSCFYLTFICYLCYWFFNDWEETEGSWCIFYKWLCGCGVFALIIGIFQPNWIVYLFLGWIIISIIAGIIGASNYLSLEKLQESAPEIETPMEDDSSRFANVEPTDENK